jgi:hypothetical protein
MLKKPASRFCQPTLWIVALVGLSRYGDERVVFDGRSWPVMIFNERENNGRT